MKPLDKNILMIEDNQKFMHIPIIMLTSRDLDVDRHYASLSNVEGYLVKTEPVETILSKVASSIYN